MGGFNIVAMNAHSVSSIQRKTDTFGEVEDTAY